jgi:glycosyltransferase involved in cell wall biosynthesis
LKYVMITNIPAPYREKVHERASAMLEGEYHVLYAHEIEPDRQWEFERGRYSQAFLKKRYFKYKDRYIHFNFNIIKELNRLNPQVVITTGYNPFFLFAFIWALLKKRKHICMTDGWIGSERHLSWVHRAIRRIVFRYSSAFIGASKHSLNLFIRYGCNKNALFQSQLCANNDLFRNHIPTEKKFDIIFSGQFIPRKMPLFFVEVAAKLTKRLKHCRALVMGDGPLKEKFIKKLKENDIEFSYSGYVQQKDLPNYYASGRILLFPTLLDPWGVVVNEACAVGLPVITCENAGVAHDLIIHEHNGYILPLDVDVWVQHALQLLENEALYKKMSDNSLVKVQEYSFERAARGIVEAIRFSENN